MRILDVVCICIITVVLTFPAASQQRVRDEQVAQLLRELQVTINSIDGKVKDPTQFRRELLARIREIKLALREDNDPESIGEKLDEILEQLVSVDAGSLGRKIDSVNENLSVIRTLLGGAHLYAIELDLQREPPGGTWPTDVKTLDSVGKRRRSDCFVAPSAPTGEDCATIAHQFCFQWTGLGLSSQKFIEVRFITLHELQEPTGRRYLKKIYCRDTSGIVEGG